MIIKPNPEFDKLTPILFGHAAFQYLKAGCELGLFELLHNSPGLSKIKIGESLGLAERATDTLLLGTTSLELLTLAEEDTYQNSRPIEDLFDGGFWDTFKSVTALEGHIVYDGLTDFVASLRDNTNVGLRRVPGEGRDLYHRLSENPRLSQIFYWYMNRWSEVANDFLLQNIDFGGVRAVLDVGGGDGVNAIALVKAHDHLLVTVLELPSNAPVTRQTIADAGVADRVDVVECDILANAMPTGYDCVVFAHQLVIWTPQENIGLLRRARDALVPGGRVVIINSMSNDRGDGPLMAALDSAYFTALPAEGGMIYAWQQYEEWLRIAGFSDIRRIELDSWTPHGIVTALA